MQLLEESLRVKYQVRKNLFVTCYLDVVDATAEGFKAQVGIRIPGDTVIPTGTKLYLAHTHEDNPLQEGNMFEMYYVTVKGVESLKGMPVQVCSAITKEKREDLREIERKDCYFEIRIAEVEEGEYTAINGSIGGLTVMYQTDKRFSGLVLGSNYHFTAQYKNELLSVPSQITHIHYDWHTNQHLMGLKVLNLTRDQEVILNKLIDPAYTIEIKHKSLVDADEARIRVDN